uniref:tRNA-uridine aminocarboxypropyltransferase 1 n=1 Tax=Salmo trutta TaxID=8032 RepID=A0A673ZWR4_SALTR
MSSPKSPLAKTQHPDKDKVVTKQNPASPPLHGLKLAPHRELEQAQQRGRLKCSSCGGSRMFFCYTCCSLVGVSQQEIPSVKLPIKIDIIKHPSEVDGKSTAIHAKILAPDDVTIYTYPCIPEYEDDTDKVVLVFPDEEPSPKRPRAEETLRHQGPVPSRVVFIDSTWNQTTRIITDETTGLQLEPRLKTRKTCFWRHQKGSPDTYLATIEAVYYFLKDYQELCLRQEYTRQYDNLMYFYCYLHTLINKAKTTAGRR